MAGSGINSRQGAQVSSALGGDASVRRSLTGLTLPIFPLSGLSYIPRQVLAESNYFDDVQNPIETKLEGGYVVSKNNVRRSALSTGR